MYYANVFLFSTNYAAQRETHLPGTQISSVGSQIKGTRAHFRLLDRFSCVYMES